VSLPVVAALGAGRMGRGIAHAFAYAGHDVLLVDLKDRTADAARKLAEEALSEVDASLATLASLGAFDDAERPRILARIRFVARADAPAALARADVAFEGVPEVIESKREAFALACRHLRADAIVASTTSTMLSTELAGFVTHPERFLNAHWLNPAYVVPLVELSPHPGTAPAVVERTKTLLEAIGKVPVVCAAVPGFIASRMQALMMNEAARMLEQGVASAEDIDRAVRYGLGFRYANIGLVEFIDVGGLDILYYASRYLAQSTGDARYASPEIVNRYMHEGRDGLRTGAGFYDWKAIDVAAYRREVLGRQLAALRQLGLLKPPGPAPSG
jgi:3-hydroxybutyryl-CoA dehydrogenase